MSRAAFVARALGKVVRAIPAELLHSVLLARRVTRMGTAAGELPTSVVEPRSVIYLRVDPTLKWLGAQVGGAATHTSGVINGLIDNGVAVQALAAERPLGVERAGFQEVPVRRVLDVARGLTYADYSDAMLTMAGSLQADFVYQRHQMGAYAGLALARRLGVPLVLEFNGPEIWVERNWRSGRLLFAGRLEQLEQRNLKDASLVVVVSAPLRDYVLAHGVAPERVLVNPNGVDVAALAPYRELTPGQWRERLGLPDRPTVGFIGTFGLWHGVKLLPSLIEAVPKAHWVLIGGGGLLEEVREEINARGLSARVTLTGVLERPQALQLLSCAEVCVSPHVPNPDGSPFFGSPTKLFEYMGLQRAIVASDLDQIGEVIEDGRSGLLCPPGDVAAAAASVQRLLADDSLRGQLAEGALVRAQSEYTWSAHVRRILDALASPPHSSNPRLASFAP
jgi:glycosyltransferase involved in cell wall biosynthesis